MKMAVVISDAHFEVLFKLMKRKFSDQEPVAVLGNMNRYGPLTQALPTKEIIVVNGFRKG